MIQIFLPRRLKKSIKNKSLFNVIGSIVSILLVFVLFACGLKITEEYTWIEAFWQSWQTITTVGYGNAPAVTVAGRMVTMIFGIIGLTMLGAVIAKISEFMEDDRRKLMTGNKTNPYKEGYIIFNYPGDSSMKKLIRQWRAIEKNVPVCLVDENETEKPKAMCAFENTHFISGSLLSEDTYKRACIDKNAVVIIYPTGDNSSCDATTSKISDLLNKFIGETTRIICVVRDITNNRWLFNPKKVTLIDEDLETTLIVQECQDRYTAPAIEKLLSNTEGANPETVEIKYAVGRTWFEFQNKTMEYFFKNNLRVNFFALIRQGETYTCPEYNTVLMEKDFISIILYTEDKINWCKIEKDIFKDS